MGQYEKNHLLFLISPAGLSLLSFAPLVLSLMIPPDTYEFFVQEKDLMWSTPFMPVFYCLCVAAFVFGAYAATFDWKSLAYFRRLQQNGAAYNFLIVLYLLGFVIALNVYSFLLILRNTPNLIENIIGGQGALIKDTISTEGALASSQPLLIVASIWAYFRYLQHRDSCKLRILKRILAAEIYLAVGLSVAISVAKVARYEMMPLLIGVAVVYCYDRSRRGHVPIFRVALQLALFGVGIIGIFVLFSLLRGAENAYFLLGSLLGYGPTAFNHLCAVLNGTLQFPFAGRGLYTFTFLADIPLFHNFMDVAASLNWPDLKTAYMGEFVATQKAGLFPRFNWVTAFGYYYCDAGDLVYAYIFGTGLLTGAAWRSFLRGNAFGVASYPFFAAAIALSFSFNIFPGPEIVTTLGGALAIRMLEVMFGRPTVVNRALRPAIT